MIQVKQIKKSGFGTPWYEATDVSKGLKAQFVRYDERSSYGINGGRISK